MKLSPMTYGILIGAGGLWAFHKFVKPLAGKQG